MFQLGDTDKAEGYLLKIIELGVADENTLGMLFKLYKGMGLDDRQAYIRLYSHMERHYRETSEDKLADEYLDALNQVSLY